ncbi:hypothetical protein HF086_007021 [Spodoptera exigua]|uniref:Uncharacterized protein n=1 Tax=Spodoptera exigua TaxID=7107 RepID=A0A922MYH9_SPOEX|nr:hypothetical protein HF086_007021 [Spodoptera exigua]
MQERQAEQQQQQQQQKQQQMIQERHQHIMSVSSQDGERRMIQSVTYSTPGKPRAQTPHHIDRKDARTVVSTVTVGPAGAGAAGAAGAAGDGRARPAEGTLTAASLIDAIITHQISQSSDQRFPQQERVERGVGVGVGVGAGVGVGPAGGAGPTSEEPAGHTTSIKLGDLASNIITRDFCSPTTSVMHHNNRFTVGNSEGYVAGSAEEWKRRDAPKHAPYLEPVSPPDNHPANRYTQTFFFILLAF